MYHPSDRVPKIAIYNFQKPSLSQLCFIAMYQGQMILATLYKSLWMYM